MLLFLFKKCLRLTKVLFLKCTWFVQSDINMGMTIITAWNKTVPLAFHLNNGRAHVYTQAVQTRWALKTIPLFSKYNDVVDKFE